MKNNAVVSDSIDKILAVSHVENLAVCRHIVANESEFCRA